MAKKRSKKKEAGEIEFVEEYIRNGRNAKQAYKKFRPKVTDRTAETEASKLLRNPKVSAYLAKREKELQKASRLTTENVLKELARIVFVDPRKFYHEDGQLKEPHELDDDTAAALASIEADELFEGHGEDRKHVGTTKKIKFWNKGDAIRDAMKHLGLFEKDREQLGKALARAIIVPAKQASAAKG